MNIMKYCVIHTMKYDVLRIVIQSRACKSIYHILKDARHQRYHHISCTTLFSNKINIAELSLVNIYYFRFASILLIGILVPVNIMKTIIFTLVQTFLFCYGRFLSIFFNNKIQFVNNGGVCFSHSR